MLWFPICFDFLEVDPRPHADQSCTFKRPVTEGRRSGGLRGWAHGQDVQGGPCPGETMKTGGVWAGPWMHRHGTLKGRWKALVFGMVWVLVGWLVARPAWLAVFQEAVPRPPTGTEASLLIGGGLLIVVGLILGLTPHFLWLLRSFYKEDFAPWARCPVMLVCPGCGAYNNRARFSCSQCSGSLAGAKAAGGQESPVAGIDAQAGDGGN